MNTSPTIGALCTALAKARVEFKPAVKDARNPFFKSAYLTLAAAHEATDAALSKHGLVAIQTTDIENGATVLVTTLGHSSGEWISGKYPVNPVKNDPQGIGSSISYARRYSLMAIIGLAAEDDDGQAASHKKVTTDGEVVTKKPSWTDDQLKEVGSIFQEIFTLGDVTGQAEVEKLRSKHKFDPPSVVIDAACELLAKWRDIADQNLHASTNPRAGAK